MAVSDRLIIAGVLNANAGKGTSREGISERIALELQRASSEVRLFLTKDIAELDAAIAEIARMPVDVFVLSGGDGSLHTVLSRYLAASAVRHPERPLPRILYIPTGTVRIVGSSLGLNGTDPEEFAQRAAKAFALRHALREERAHILRINDEYGFIYGAGLPVNFLDQYYAGETLGPFGASRVLFETLTDEMVSALLLSESNKLLTKPVHGVVRLPNGHVPPMAPFAEHTAVLASAVEQVGYGIKGMPLARSKEGHFMLRSSQLSFADFVGQSLALVLGMTDLHRTFDAVVPRVEIEWAQPTRVTIDGEMKPPRDRDVISCGPLLRFLAA